MRFSGGSGSVPTGVLRATNTLPDSDYPGLKALADFRLKPVLRRDCDHDAGTVPNHPARRASESSRYSHRKVGRAVPVTPLRGVTGEPHAGSVGQAFLPALVGVRRQECPRHIGEASAEVRKHRWGDAVPPCRSDERCRSLTFVHCARVQP